MNEIELSSDSPDELIALFEQRGWGDGLPLVAPTKDRVDAMLTDVPGTQPPDADEVIATLAPRLGEATRRMIAVNAVLAGCPNGVLPVLVSAVRALARPELNLRGVNAKVVQPGLVRQGDSVTKL